MSGEAIDRRGFLQWLAGSAASAAAVAGCGQGRETALPYGRQPPEVVPGRALHFASASVLDGAATGLLVTSHAGRPTKVEGNRSHPASLGATTAQHQAMIASLYDPRRASIHRHRGEPRSWSAVVDALRSIAARHREDDGRSFRLLLEPTSSPTLLELRARVARRFPRAVFHRLGPFASGHAADGARLAFGRRLLVRYDLARATTVLSLDADLLGTMSDRLRHARGFAETRVGKEVGRLYAAEASMTLTGAAADERLPLRSAEIEAAARRLVRSLAALAGSPLDRLRRLPSVPLAAEATRWIDAAAAALHRAGPSGLVAVGPRQPPVVHALAHAIHAALGSVGRTVHLSRSPLLDAEPQATLSDLVGAIDRGEVESLVVTAWNPVYRAPADLPLAERFASVPSAFYLATHEDETSAACAWFVPKRHELESWEDARALDGTVTFQQPLIEPLFHGRQESELWAEVLGGASATSTDPREILVASWRERTGSDGFDERWERWLRDGFQQGTASAAEPAPVRWPAIAAALAAPPATAGGVAVEFRLDEKVHDGRFGRNRWLQELPHPSTSIAWDNAALVAPATARRLRVENGDVVRISLGGRGLEAPVWIDRGHVEEAVTLPLGYGREVEPGERVGFDAGAIRRANAPWFDAGATIVPAGRRHRFAVVQEHHRMDGRPLALAVTAASFDPHSLDEHRGPLPTLFGEPAPAPFDHGHRWAMAIDLARCVGCAACVIACQAENNIPVVGREGVARGREMHWLRIDRYYEGEDDRPTVVSQPVACVHCEDAPCEYVCPVNATVHSDEGLNEMVYNRCVGTRFCSNNCPYKVRRFNYFHYQADRQPVEELALNPDVTVRARGVMEKCTYCVQRIERARIDARVAGVPLDDGAVVTACAQACPAEAIVFGDLADPTSRVSRLHRNDRRYDLLHALGTRPRTAYLVKLRNPDPELA